MFSFVDSCVVTLLGICSLRPFGLVRLANLVAPLVGLRFLCSFLASFWTQMGFFLVQIQLKTSCLMLWQSTIRWYLLGPVRFARSLPCQSFFLWLLLCGFKEFFRMDFLCLQTISFSGLLVNTSFRREYAMLIRENVVMPNTQTGVLPLLLCSAVPSFACRRDCLHIGSAF